jgi:hypothetical protein
MRKTEIEQTYKLKAAEMEREVRLKELEFKEKEFFLVKYLIFLMFCFIMYWPTDNSDILRLYNGGSGGIVTG